MDKSTLEYLSIDLKDRLDFIHCGKLVADSFVHAQRRIGIYVLIVMTSGTLNIEINGTRYKAQKGDAVLLPADYTHSGFRDEDSDKKISYIWVHFAVHDEYSFNSPCGSDTRIPIHFKLSNPSRAYILCNQLLDISKTAPDITYCSFLFSALVCEISSQAHMISISSNKTVNTAAAWLELHITEPVSLELTASELGYNKRYLARIFKQFMGISVNKYIEKRKIELAKNMLTGSDESVTAIAAEIGYADAGYFMRVFKKYEGMTCLEYRRAYTKMYLNRE